ncbi:MAG: succinate dehydrogenase assembly factor 2 [Hyphomicrobiales bacterium]|nr:succinate dehydrogenase assembly factor 2 [Hyphomicrobiales bacterium]
MTAVDTKAELDTRRRAIRVRAWRRGMREMDILIGNFVDARIADLDARDVGDLERLLDVEDQKAFSWLCGTEPPPPDHNTPVFAKIVAFHRHDGPVDA